jgi:6-phosphogluconolactonase
MNLITYAGLGPLASGVADAILADLSAAIAQHGRATLCVAGGTTPAPMFDILAHAPIDWSKVTVMPTDERWVDESDPRSNAALIKKHLLQGAAQSARYIGLYTKDQSAQAALGGIAGSIAPHLPISVLLAGMGADLHTASLFPDAQNIAAAMADDAPAVMIMHPKSQPEARITLTAPVLRAAPCVHIMISGAAKRAALQSMDTAAPTRAPVGILMPHAQVHWAE